MFTNIIMMNIKNIFITTGISVLFGVYSIYNILETLRVLNNHHIKQINSLKHLLSDTKKKYNNLQKNHDELVVNYEQINKEIYLLNIKICELQENKTTNINLDTNDISNDLNYKISKSEDREIINSISDDIDEEFIDSLSLDYDFSETDNSEKRLIQSSSRSIAIIDINWINLTKKYLFG